MSKQQASASKNASKSDEEIRRLVMARLQALSSDVSISLGDEGDFNREELIAHVQRDDEIGRALEEMQMEWLRSWKLRAVGV
jgi:hypothetical protein